MFKIILSFISITIGLILYILYTATDAILDNHEILHDYFFLLPMSFFFLLFGTVLFLFTLIKGQIKTKSKE
ncbi:MAG: DUF3955 domain-containing protein [Enterococcus sp.]